MNVQERQAVYKMESSKIYLCRADCSMLGNISGLKAETCSLKKHVAEQWEITFDVERYSNDNSCELKQSDYYDSIDTMMRLYLDGKDQIFFVIDSEPVIKGEGLQEIKTVTAHSIECELSALILKNFKINCGTKDSQEYLATDSNGNFNNINPYTNLPHEYISLVNYDNPQLSLLHLALHNTGWTVGKNIDPEICNIKRNFDISSTNIYDFFTNTVSPSASVIFQFDRKHKKVGLIKGDDFGEDTGIFVTMRNLMKSFEISASSNDELITRLYPTGTDNLGVEQVNFGKNYITSLDHFMNTMNEYGDYKYVSKELHDKYILWKNYREIDKITFNGKKITRREQYIELSKLYNKTILDINELKNRVPNDGAVTDYKTFSLNELKLHLNAFNKALVSLITIYKNEYGATEIGNPPNYPPTPSSAVSIKDTPYWHDYYAYQESIIPQIKEALKMYCQTDSNGNLMTDANGHFIEMEFGNPAYYADPSIVKEVDAYKYEWSLYGLDELESKKKAWCEVANLLFNECFIKSGTVAAPTAYRTPDDNGWNSLSDAQKKKFTSKSAYIDKLNQYLDYMSFNTRNNSLTKTNCKGIIRQCEDAIVSRRNEITSLQNFQINYQTQRKELANSVAIENFKVNNIILFTEQDLNVINSMIREQDYNNSNILTTNLDDIVTLIDAQEELYQAANEELYKLSQPQYSFSTDMENLYALEEFQCYHDDFEVGNFIRAGFEIHEELFDNEFIKLRLMSITYNPLDISSQDISVEFSTMTKELNGVSDLASLFGEYSSSSSGSSSGASSSGGTYGNNDANVQMSNNMLNALLSTELFGTTVTDVILDSIKGNKGNFNTLLSHSGVFDSLEAGRIKISGECLFDIIKSSNYVAGKSGSFLDLLTGSFDFAGGKLKWNDDKLSIDGSGSFTGDIVANSLKLGQNVKIDNTSISGLSKVATTGDFNDLSNTSDILMTDDVSIESTTDLNGVTTKTINVGEHTYTTKESDNYILTNVGLGTNTDKHDKTFFVVSKNGLLEANNALIYGTIFATDGRFSGEVYATSGSFTGDIVANSLTAIKSGNIAGWTFNEDGFHRSNSDETFSQSIDSNGISISDFFFIQPEGFITSDPQYYKTICDYQWTGQEQLSSNIYLDGSKDEGNTGSYICIYAYGYESSTITLTGSFIEDFEQDDSNDEEEKTIIISESMICKIDNYVKIYLTVDDIFFGYHFDNATHFPSALAVIKSVGLYDNIGKRIGMYKIDVFSSQNKIKNTFYLNTVRSYDDFVINSLFGQVSLKTLDLCPLGINAFSEFEFNIYPDDNSNVEPKVTISSSSLKHAGVYDTTVSSGSQLRISADGTIQRYSSSSKRYKKDITDIIPSELNPQKLYDLNVVSYKYLDHYLPANDQRYKHDILGFIAEDVYEKYPEACNLNDDGLPEMWEINILFPAALKLIQEQHKEIIALSEQIETMKQQFQRLKTCIIN
jgi:hypothetical protein